MKSKVPGAQSYYDEISSEYDEFTKAEGAWNAPKEVDEALDHFNPKEPAIIIGVGTGQDVIALNKHNVYDIEGVDISSKMLIYCKLNFPSVKTHHLDFNAEPISFDRKFHTVICSGTSEFIEDIALFFNKTASLMRPGGIFIFTFEPIIYHHDIQKEKSSSPLITASGRKPPANFITYRRDLFEILRVARLNNLFAIHQKAYVSYKKGRDSIIYNLVVFVLG